MKNQSNSHSGQNRGNNRNSYSYPQRSNREWDTLENRHDDGTSQTGGSYDRRNNYGAYTTDYQGYPGRENRNYDSQNNARRRDEDRYDSRSWNEDRDRQHSNNYNEDFPGSNYSSRHDFGSRSQYRNDDDRNFFERAGDRIRQKWNDWTDKDRDHDNYENRSFRPDYNDYENRQNYSSNYNDRDDYNNSYSRYTADRGYSAANGDRDYYPADRNNKSYSRSRDAYNSGYTGDQRYYGPDNRYSRDRQEREYGYGTSTRAYNGNRGNYGSDIRSTEDFAW